MGEFLLVHYVHPPTAALLLGQAQSSDQKFCPEFIGLNVIRTNLNSPTTGGWTWTCTRDQGWLKLGWEGNNFLPTAPATAIGCLLTYSPICFLVGQTSFHIKGNIWPVLFIKAGQDQKGTLIRMLIKEQTQFYFFKLLLMYLPIILKLKM